VDAVPGAGAQMLAEELPGFWDPGSFPCTELFDRSIIE
jgi:hypothetical protein